MRPLPEFVLLGAQKAGTTSLYAYLTAAPGILPALEKEVHFFDVEFHRGEAWYRSMFPTRLERAIASRRAGHVAITGEASPYYLFHPPAPRRLRALLPDAKLIVVLRDPVDRAVSHHNHNCVKGLETLPFEEAIERELERVSADAGLVEHERAEMRTSFRHHSYLSRGRYAEQLERWFAEFPREQFLVLGSGELFADPEGTTARACRFLGVPLHRLDRYEAKLARRYDGIDPGLRRRLDEYFAPHNRALSDLLEKNLKW